MRRAAALYRTYELTGLTGKPSLMHIPIATALEVIEQT
jgi:hypothetical protein